MKYVPFIIPAVLAVMVGVTGCGKPENRQAASGSRPAHGAVAPAKEKSAVTPDLSATEKLNAYSEGYNRIMRGTGGLSGTYERLRHFAAAAKTSDDLSLPTMSNLGSAIVSFKKGLAIGGGMDDLDAALNPAVKAGEELLARQKELELYFTSKAYRDDDLAKGKAALPQLLATYDAMIAAMGKVDDLLTKHQRAAAEKRLAHFKGKGDMLHYHTEQGMLYAQDMLAVFEPPEKTVPFAESYARADDILARLETSLQEHRRVIETEKGKGARVDPYDSVNNNLVSLVANYRDLREKKTADAYNAMTKSYNDAVDSYNRAARSSR